MTQSHKLFLTAAMALLSATSAWGGTVAVSFTSPTLMAQPGDTVTFGGTLSNLSALSYVDLNGCGVSLLGQVTTDNCALFFANAPLSLSPSETFGPFDMFSVSVNVPYTGPFGVLTGTFTVQGFVEAPGDLPTDGATLNVLDEQQFYVEVVPEPGTAGLMVLASLLAFAYGRKWRASRPAPARH